ncbi:MAG TPA: excisionase family DNA-binding protein [Microbacterium sp.]|uniref:excisionase family DNA-binding protein n=1 Tax=Microbacterium sp. TaxID=51671 RepID=UPI002B4A7841|nr:excisionase family DNA-binding protein [Microbacterium sp.]HKT56498.1 excisionase family DNA-binding protein [Microbacterium sp.]
MSSLMPMGIGPIEDRDEQQLNELADALQGTDPVTREQEFAELPAPVREALADVLHRFARGEAVVVGSAATLLTTGQAAAMLGMSRSYLVRLIDEGKVQCEFVGTHRRVRLEEALRYGAIFRARRSASLDEIAGVSREAGLYDDDEF